MKYFSMFSGIGGFELGIERAYRNKQSAKVEQDWQGRNGNADERGRDVLPSGGSAPLCIGFCEVNKYAVQIYQKHFPEHNNYGDATRIVPEELPDFDLLCGGFPCQAFSIAGKRGGFKDTRGTLFFEIARILAVKRPQLLLLENVKGLLSHDRGRTFGTILATLSELGYLCEWQVLNSKDFGVPQNRERVFIVGHLGGTGGREVFPVGVDNQKAIGLQGQPTTNCLKARYEAIGDGSYVVESKLNAQGENNISSCLRSQQGGIYKRHLEKFNGMRIRRLTPTECERLQGFPDGWTEGISDSQRYKCLGNAVTVNVIQAIMSKIIERYPKEIEMSEHTPTPYLIGKPDREWNEFIKVCNEISSDQMHHEARVITFGSDPNDPNYRIICLLGPGPHAHDNAEFIVDACNSHAKLISQNKRLREAAKEWIQWFDYCHAYQQENLGKGLEQAEENWGNMFTPDPSPSIDKLRQALNESE